MVSRISLVDDDTGAVLEGTVLTFDQRKAPPKARFDAPWMAFFDAGLDALMDEKLTVSDYRIFFALVQRAVPALTEWEIRSREVAERLQMDERRVRRGVAKLVEAGLLSRPRRGFLAFEPRLFWRGSSSDRVTVLRDMEIARTLEHERTMQEWRSHRDDELGA